MKPCLPSLVFVHFSCPHADRSARYSASSSVYIFVFERETERQRERGSERVKERETESLRSRIEANDRVKTRGRERQKKRFPGILRLLICLAVESGVRSCDFTACINAVAPAFESVWLAMDVCDIQAGMEFTPARL